MVSFDPNLRWRLMHRERSRPVLASLLSDVDVLITGADELTWLAGYERVEEATAWALDAGPRLVIVKQARPRQCACQLSR
jgi:sugar/nucleoside kinase (ribokinase family)